MALQTLSLESDAYIDYTLHEDQEALVQNNRDIGNLRVRHIKSLTITNFKSFQGKHYVGPFTDFTAVIGPNGGGKSNVLDAIAFALGLTIRDLRCASPEELVYSKQQYQGATAKKSQQEDPDEAAASVEIVFTTNTPELLRIRRTLSLNGHANIYINDAQLSEEDFGHFLLQSKVHVASRNFMLLQGEADFLATASPATMTELFERMSGSIQFKKECVLLEKRLEGVKQKINDLSHQKAQLRTEQKKLKELLQTSAQYRTINNEINELRLKIKLIQLYEIDKSITEQIEALRQAEASQNNQQGDKHEILVTLQKCDLSVKHLQRSLIALQQDVKVKERSIQELLKQKQQVDQNKKFGLQSIQAYEQNIKKLQVDQKSNHQMVQELDKDIQAKELALGEIIKQGKVQIPEKYMEEYQSLQQTFKNQHFALESEAKKLQQQEQLLTELSSSMEASLRQAQSQFNQINSSYSVEEGEHSQLNQQCQQYDERLQVSTNQLKTLEDQNKKQQDEIKRFELHRVEKEKIIQLNEIMMAEHIEEEESRRLVQQLSATFPKFMGELSGLMNPVSQQWSTAMKLAFGQRLLCALVVQDTTTNISINKMLKTLGVVKDMIILDKVKHRDERMEQEIRRGVENLVEDYRKGGGKGRQARNGKAMLAIDALECEKVVETVAGYLIRGTILTDSYQLAVHIQQANLPGVYQIITQDGVQLQQGMILSNPKANTLRNFRKGVTQAQKGGLKESIAKAQKELEDIKQHLRSLHSTSIQGQLKEVSVQKLQLEEQVTASRVAIMHKERRLKFLAEQRDQISAKVHELKKDYDSKAAQLEQIKERLTIVHRDIKGHQGTLYKEFAKKTGLPEGQLLAVVDSEQLMAKKDALEGTLNKLMLARQEELAHHAHLEKKIQELKIEVENSRGTDGYEEQIENFKKQQAQVQADLDKLVDEEYSRQKELKAEQQRLKQLVDKRDTIMKRNVDVVQSITSHRNKLQLLIAEKQKALEDCEMESVEIGLKIKDEVAETQEVDYTPIQALLKTDDAESLIQQQQRKLVAKEKDAAKYLSENLQVGLIGGKSDERFEKLEQQMKDISERLSHIYDEEKEISVALKASKQQRAERFHQLFKRVSEEIDTLYKTLTFQESTQLGGSALLYLENQQEPFNGGIIYTTTPPNKKYVFDISEQLSGGEKAMASVALQFAINSALGTPFLLLDEIDANLDQDNTMRLRMVMQAFASKPMQFIAISHNIDMFGKAKSLIGVTIQHRRLTSEAFSMLLD